MVFYRENIAKNEVGEQALKVFMNNGRLSISITLTNKVPPCYILEFPPLSVKPKNIKTAFLTTKKKKWFNILGL